MLKVSGLDTRSDTKLLRDFSNFVLRRFMTVSQIRKSNISIEFLFPEDLKDRTEIPEFREYSAWLLHDDAGYQIQLNKACINKKSTVAMTRYKQLMKYLAHELVHVKQYATGEMRDVHDGDHIDTWWKGEVYPDADKFIAVNPQRGKWKYFDSPWEIEAYGRMEGLYHMYSIKDEV